MNDNKSKEYSQYSDSYLMEMLEHKTEYTEEAFELIRKEVKRRGYNENTLKNKLKRVEDEKKQQEKNTILNEKKFEFCYDGENKRFRYIKSKVLPRLLIRLGLYFLIFAGSFLLVFLSTFLFGSNPTVIKIISILLYAVSFAVVVIMGSSLISVFSIIIGLARNKFTGIEISRNGIGFFNGQKIVIKWNEILSITSFSMYNDTEFGHYDIT